MSPSHRVALLHLPSIRALLAALVALALLAPVALAQAPPDASDPLAPRVLRVAVDLEPALAAIGEIRALELDLHALDRKAGEAYLLVDEAGFAQLEGLGLAPRLVEEMTPSTESLEALSDYMDPDEVDAFLDDTAAAYPNITEIFSYDTLTHEGRVVRGMKISDNAESDEPEPRIFFVSQHHAREVMTPEALVDMIDYLTVRYGVDEEITRFIDEYEIYVVPVHNPDGTFQVFNGNTGWRKNRRDNQDGTFGVDPNRNYPYAWGPDGCGGSSGSTGSDTYRGPSAGSEPETAGLIELVRAWRPSISLTYHTYSELVLHPFGCNPALPDDPDLRAHREIGSRLAAVIENDAGDGWYEMGTPYELLYEVDGDSDGWLHGIAGAVAFTIEMSAASQGFQPDYDTWRDDTVARNRDGWLWLLRRLGGGGVQGLARDACSGDPLSARIGVAEQNFTQGQDPRTAVPAHGFFHRILEPGAVTFYGELEGYARQEWPVEVAFEPLTRDLWLVPEGSHAAALDGFVVDDAGGDADGQLDPGEELDLIPRAYATGAALSGLGATLSTSDPYLELLDDSASFGALEGGGRAEALDAFRVRVLPDAPDGHVAEVTISFVADQALCRDGEATSLRLTRGFPATPFVEESLDADPGWSTEGPADGWAFGEPAGGGGTTGPDRAATGDFVYGTRLDGNYGTSAGEFILTTEAFDLQGLRDAELVYERWLNNEPGYDLAFVEVSVDGQSWEEVWRGFGRDTGWISERIALPESIDGAEQAYVRFRMIQDGGGSRSGWYVDDLRFEGENALIAGGRLRYESHAIVEDDPLYGNADGESDANETLVMPVTLRSTRTEPATGVTAVLTTTDPAVTIHDDVAYFPQIDAGAAATSLAPHFSFTAGPDCAARIPFELEIRADDGSATTSRFSVPIGTLEPATLFTDDMESDRGWTTEEGGADGQWERNDPTANFNGGEMTNPEDDHTADPGVTCWATRNVPPPTTAPPTAAEVDGSQTLITPLFDASAFETLDLSYWRWFYVEPGASGDRLYTEVSSDGGLSWRVVEQVGTKANAWTEELVELAGQVDFTDQFLVRFVALDAGPATIVEAGIDDVSLAGTAWFCDVVDFGAPEPPNPVPPTLMVERQGFDVRLDWEAPPADENHGEATFYRVRRSLAPEGAFDDVANPRATFHVELGVAGPSDGETYFYLVASENRGGVTP